MGEWINCGLGVWIAVSPWVLGFQHTAGMFVNLAIGVLIAYLALLDLWLFHYLVGACTGISAGFSPLRMRST